MYSLANTKHVKVSNMTSNSGNKIANQFEIDTTDGTYFQSYDSIIAFVPVNKEEAFYKFNKGSLADNGLETYPDVYLDSYYWDYSVTTGKYRNLFLREKKAETEAKIKSGEYKLIDLNGGR